METTPDGDTSVPTPVPPPPVPPVVRHVPRPGELTPGWQAVVVAGWVAVVIALAAVWGTSRQLGLSTWWLGPVAEPRPFIVMLLPFAPAAIVIAAALLRIPHVAWIAVAAAALLAIVGLVDVTRVAGLGVLELVIALCGALVGVAATSGAYRRAPGPVPDPAGAPAS